MALALALALATACAADHSAELEQLWGGPAGLAALRADGPVSVALLDPGPGPRVLELSEVTVREAARPLSAADARALRDALAREEAYLWNVAKACLPTWGALLEFGGEAPALQVLLCLECDMLNVHLDGARVGGEDFDPVRSDLVRALQSAFPADPVIRDLGTRR